jgi:hypothetical protein
MKEMTSSVLQRFHAEDSGSVAGLAWLRGARERCAVASARRLEQRHMVRGKAEWASARWLLWEEERTGFSFGLIARGEDARGGGCMCCAWRPGGRWRASEQQLAQSGCNIGGRHQRGRNDAQGRVRKASDRAPF